MYVYDVHIVMYVVYVYGVHRVRAQLVCIVCVRCTSRASAACVRVLCTLENGETMRVALVMGCTLSRDEEHFSGPFGYPAVV